MKRTLEYREAPPEFRGKEEHRRAEIRAVPDGDGRTFEALAVAYGIVDDYGTRFLPGVFNDSLKVRMPVLAWGHDWREPIGRVTDWRETDEGLFITGRLSDPEAVPRARQAMAQLRDGDLTDVSVGFMRLADQTAEDGVTEIVRGELDEVSLVLRGAVPGSRVMSVRTSTRGAIDLEAVLEIAKRKAAGDLSAEEAQAAVDLLAADPKPAAAVEEPPVEEEPVEPVPDPELDAALVDADAALALIERSR